MTFALGSAPSPFFCSTRPCMLRFCAASGAAKVKMTRMAERNFIGVPEKNIRVRCAEKKKVYPPHWSGANNKHGDFSRPEKTIWSSDTEVKKSSVSTAFYCSGYQMFAVCRKFLANID